MKFFAIFALFAVASADVSHLTSSNGYLPPRNQYLPPSAPSQGSYNLPAPIQGSYNVPAPIYNPVAAPAPTYGVPAQSFSTAIGVTGSAAQTEFTGQYSTGFIARPSATYGGPVPTPSIQPIRPQVFAPAVQPTYLPPVQPSYRPAYQASFTAPARPQFVPAVAPTYIPPVPQSLQIEVRPAVQAPVLQQVSFNAPLPSPVTRPFASFTGPQSVSLIPEPIPAHSFGADGYQYRNPNQF